MHIVGVVAKGLSSPKVESSAGHVPLPGLRSEQQYVRSWRTVGAISSSSCSAMTKDAAKTYTQSLATCKQECPKGDARFERVQHVVSLY